MYLFVYMPLVFLIVFANMLDSVIGRSLNDMLSFIDSETSLDHMRMLPSEVEYIRSPVDKKVRTILQEVILNETVFHHKISLVQIA